MAHLTPPPRLAWAINLAAVILSPSALAQDGAAASESSYGARAEVRRPIPSLHQEDATASVTSVEVAGRPAAAETVSDLLMEVPGARPFRTGTLGSFTSASLRGAQFDHTSVLFGDLPISGADAGAFNLSTIPVSVLDRVVVFRGGAPVWFSQGAIGGVLRLEPRKLEGTFMSATGELGSFGLWGLRTTAAVVPSRADERGLPSVLGSVGAAGSQGDFEFLYDNKTSLDPADDYVARRRNADSLDGHGLVHVRQPLRRGEWGHLDLVGLGFERVGGEAGSAADPLFTTRRNLTRALGSLAWTKQLRVNGYRRYRLQVMGGGGYARHRFSDRFAELGEGGPREVDSRDGRAFGRMAGSLGVTPWLEFTSIFSGQYDNHEAQDPFARPPLPDSHRTTLATAQELNLHGDVGQMRFELRPSVRVEYTDAALSSERFGELVRTGVDEVMPTYRVAGVVAPISHLALSASAASGRRVPSMLELFGDGAALEGNTTLQPEQSTSFDVGVVATGGNGVWGGTAELRGFALTMDEQIVYVRKNENQLVARNQDHGEIIGMELGLRGNASRHFYLAGALTLLDTEGKPGKKLMNRPRVVANVRPELRVYNLGPLELSTAFVETNVISASFDDPDNLGIPKPSQAFVNVGLAFEMFDHSTELRLTARNVGDLRGSDIRGFQLPGRTLMAALTYTENVR